MSDTTQSATSRQHDSRVARRIRRTGLLFGAVSLAVSLGLVAVEHLEFFFNGKVGSSLTLDAVTTSVSLAAALAGWLLAVVVLYLGAGWLVGWIYSEATRRLPIAPENRVSASVLAQILVAGWVLLLNARLFPNSLFARGFVDLSGSRAGDILFVALTALIGVAAAIGLIGAAMRGLRAGRRGRAGVAATAVLAAVVGTSLFGLTPQRPQPASPSTPDRPNVVLIGVDSLRPDHLSSNGFPLALTPAIDSFLADGLLFEDTLTPLARTFPAWMSILTGREPVQHGARFNLVPDSSTESARHANLARWLSRQGYATVFATDERRFSNIDESFGFDTVIAPPMGAADFLVGGLNDLPLSNLLSNTAVGRVVFPYNYANRAAAATYRPDSFVAMVDDRLVVPSDRPVFIAAHLCLAHWPFTWANVDEADKAELPEPFTDTRPEYLETLRAVDRQFAAITALLLRRGVLDNALVVLLSDHGESFGMSKDRLLPGADSAMASAVVEANGHGTSVSALSQHQVLLAFRRFGAGPTVGRGRNPTPASLIDIAPTVMDLLGLDSSALGFDGRSLLGQAEAGGRVLSVESGFSIPAMMKLIPDPQETIRQSAQFYTVDKAGRLTIDERFLDDLVRNKERAVVLGEWMLSVAPAGDSAFRRQLINRSTLRIWDESTLSASGAPVGALTRAFCERFSGDGGVADSQLCRPDATVAEGR